MSETTPHRLWQQAQSAPDPKAEYARLLLKHGFATERKPGRPRTGRGRDSARVQVRLSAAENTAVTAAAQGAGISKAAFVRAATLAFLGLGTLACAPPLPTLPPGTFNRVDRSAQTWRYCGAVAFEAESRASLAWWAEQGLQFGPQVPCDSPADVEVLDQTGTVRFAPDGTQVIAEWFGDRGQILLWRAYWTHYGTPGLRESIMRHEFGHVFGWDHGGAPECLMYPEGVHGERTGLCESEQVQLAARR